MMVPADHRFQCPAWTHRELGAWNAGQLFLGGKLAAGANVSLNPLLSAGWAGLLANALNCIPIGERAPSAHISQQYDAC